MQWLVMRIGDGTTHSRDIHVMRVGVDSAPRPLIASPDYDEAAVTLSPDGKWIAFQSEETGRVEIFIRPFPDVNAGKWQVSRGGGVSPLWNPKGGELFFIRNQRDMMSVRVGTGESPDPTSPRLMFTLPMDMYVGVQETYTPHTISSDGSRFVMLRSVPVKESERSIAVLEHFLGR
jgi:serine/threonine-protein kinase